MELPLVVEKKQTDADAAVQAAIGLRIKQAREAMRPKMSQKALGEIVGISQQSVQELESGRNGTKHLHRYAAALHQTVEWLEYGEGEMRTDGKASASDQQRTPPELSAFNTFPKDVPIMGVTIGGTDDNSFILNMGDVVDYARRTPAIARNARVFALYVQGDSMAKWRQPGGLVYLDPARPPRAGDHVVVEFAPDELGNGVPALLKQLVAITGTKIKLRQYNPEKLIEIPVGKVRRLHRVMEWEELIS